MLPTGDGAGGSDTAAASRGLQRTPVPATKAPQAASQGTASRSNVTPSVAHQFLGMARSRAAKSVVGAPSPGSLLARSTCSRWVGVWMGEGCQCPSLWAAALQTVQLGKQRSGVHRGGCVRPLSKHVRQSPLAVLPHCNQAQVLHCPAHRAVLGLLHHQALHAKLGHVGARDAPVLAVAARREQGRGSAGRRRAWVAWAGRDGGRPLA